MVKALGQIRVDGKSKLNSLINRFTFTDMKYRMDATREKKAKRLLLHNPVLHLGKTTVLLLHLAAFCAKP